ncbi:MAG: serine/threonine protein phosphatase [Bacillota bacterium]|nr:serine/threonine protein phosphatase [Bacillota bacterium]
MYISRRLSHVYAQSKQIPFNDNSKFIFFSDCHRGDNSKADNFAPNRKIYNSALDYYYKAGYTYIEIGDGDELWENDRFSSLVNAHLDIYMSLQKFHNANRYYMIWGNHDICKRSAVFVKRNLFSYYNSGLNKFEPLFDGINLHEGLILKYNGTPYEVFVVHGHQGELINDYLWPLARFFVRHIWRYYQQFRYIDPISPARNIAKRDEIERNITGWVNTHNKMIIAGHTHHYVFPKVGETPYFNDGCCIYSGYITGIEISNGEISLVKWSQKLDKSGESTYVRDIIAGPERIENFFSS